MLGRNGPKWVVTVLAGGAAVGVCFAALIPGVVTLAKAQHYTSTVNLNLRELSQTSVVYDANGSVLGYLGLEKRDLIKSIDEVPKVLQQAVVATEDQTFWRNDGFDVAGTVRAAIKNATSGKIEQGGSTISQQLVKKRLLSSKQTVNRKVKELILAVRLNQRYSKREILTQYLNTVYFGPAASAGQGAYGVKAAVSRFFLVADPPPYYRTERLDEVTLGQAALLAGIIRSPAAYDPFAHPDAAKERRSFVLGRMLKQGYITEQQRLAAEAEPLPTINDASVYRPRDVWTEEVQRRLLNDPRLGKTPDEREKKLLRGGLRVYTTKDPALQAKADNAVYGRGGVYQLNPRPGFTAALVAIDPNSGAVKAMAVPPYEQLQYNIATAWPGRQAGSTWKTITEGAAFDSDKEFSPNDFVDGSTPCSFGKLGQTQNAEAGGGGSIRAVTEESVNCAFARIQLAVGFDKVIDTAYKMGIDPARKGTQFELKPYLTLTLGAIESSPLEMATVAATIADSGVHHDPYFVQRVTDATGRVIFDEATTNSGTQAISESAANCEMDVLRGVITHGTGGNARLAGGRIAFGKTGTTDARANAWFIGGTPHQLVAAVWHGAISGNVPGAGFGGNVAARLWARFMNSALAGEPNVDYPPPGPVCDRPGGRIGVDQTGWTRIAPDRPPSLFGPTTPTVVVNPIPTTATTSSGPGNSGHGGGPPGKK